MSLIVLLAEIATVLLAFGKFDLLGWVSRRHHVHPHLLPGQASRGQNALVKFCVVVALLLLAQTPAGAAAAHFRADPNSFYGFNPERIFPSNLMRTWRLQTAILVYYIPALFFGARANFTVVDTWRFWIIHFWVEGFFKFFVTAVVAKTFYQLGLTSRNVALRVIYLDAILYSPGGLMGTGHHWYFTGHTNVNMALSALFSMLDVVPLILLTLDAWDVVRSTRGDYDVCGKAIAIPHKWMFYFLIAVGFWSFVGAGNFGSLLDSG